MVLVADGTHWVPSCATSRRSGRSAPPREEAARTYGGVTPLVGLGPATPSAAPGSGHPSRTGTKKPRCSAVPEALCRTRTGDPFLTMAVRPSRRVLASRANPLRSGTSRLSGRPQGSARFDASGTPWVPGCGRGCPRSLDSDVRGDSNPRLRAPSRAERQSDPRTIHALCAIDIDARRPSGRPPRCDRGSGVCRETRSRANRRAARCACLLRAPGRLSGHRSVPSPFPAPTRLGRSSSRYPPAP